jgi:hypothetical protein
MEIKDISTNDLKVAAYDLIANIEGNQKTLQAVNNEIARRTQQESQTKPTMENETKTTEEEVIPATPEETTEEATA